MGKRTACGGRWGRRSLRLWRRSGRSSSPARWHRGYEQELAERVFSLIEPFAGYAFNKAHSVCYALISYWTAYFKANYPQEYMACLLNAFSENLEKVASIVSECKRLKIPVLPPDILKSEPFYSIEVGEDGEFAIRAGLASIKNVGTGAIEEFVESRASLEGPVESIEQFCRAVDASGLNRKNLESLIKAGAFDSFGDRGAILDSIDRILSVAESEARLRSSDQTSMFDMFGETVPTPLTSIELPNVETPTTEKSRWEEELLGFAVSGNEEFDAMVAENDGKAIISVSDVTAELAGRRGVMINGQVSSSEERFTRAGKRFLIAKIALLGGSVDVFVWEDILAVSSELWEPGTLVSLMVAVRVRDDDRISLSCQRAEAFVRPDERESEDDEAATTEPMSKASVPLPAPDLTLRSPSPDGGGSVPTAARYGRVWPVMARLRARRQTGRRMSRPTRPHPQRTSSSSSVSERGTMPIKTGRFLTTSRRPWSSIRGKRT